MAVLSDAQAATLLAQVNDIHTGMGALVSIVPGQPTPLVFQLLAKLGQFDDETVRLEALKTALAALEGKMQAPPAIDVAALAAALAPHLPPSVDTQAVAQAVVNEIGVRVRPAV